MSEELDNDLKRRISEVFDNYEDPTADEGWMLLREKLPATARHRGTAWLWWASAAAMFLLFVGVGLWLKTDSAKPAQEVVATQPAVKQNPPAAGTDSNETTIENAVTSTEKVVASEPAGQLAVTPRGQQQKTTVKPNTVNTVHEQAPVALPSVEQLIASISDVKPTVKPPVKKIDSTVTTSQKPAEQYAAVKQDQVNTVEKTTPVVVKQPATQPVIEKKSAMEAMLEREALANAGKVKEKGDKQKAVNFGVFAGTYMNYAEGSDNQVNVGAGFSSDFRISKNLKLSTGVSIAQNSFSYSGGTTTVPKQAVSASLVAQAVQYNDKGFGPSTATPELNNYNARLTGLDVPINLKYEFNPDKNDTYISAGLSSGTFINESYSYKYNYPAMLSTGEKDVPQPQQEVDERINNSFNGFYFGRTLNVAFGVGYPLGKNNRLVIEPFVKYPLSGLGAQQIRFGSGGINLKLNFSTGKR